jgi:carbonic anhydrase
MMKGYPVALAVILSVGLAGCADEPEASMEVEAPVSEVMTQSDQEGLTPSAALAQLKEGNQRFVERRLTARDYKAQASATASGQYPKAVVLSCLDSRVPPEIIFDQGIGDLFVGRVAGNFENVDMLGSLEFATAAAGTPLIVVLGHTQCGAIKGAVSDVELGNLTAMLDNFDEVLERVRAEQDEAAPMDAIVQAAVEENVRQTVADILDRSEVIAELVESGDVEIVGGVYDLASGEVLWMDA